MNVVTAAQMRELDRRATDVYGIPSLLLMENAGRAVADAAMEMLRGTSGVSRVLIVAGPGNNGGDGFVAARHLDNGGAEVTVVCFADRAKIHGDAQLNLEIIETIGLEIVWNPLLERLPEMIGESDLTIDALLGTGLSGRVRDPYNNILSVMEGCSAWLPFLSVDIPSGIDSDTGAFLGDVVNARATVTLGLPKIGLVTHPGASRVGRLIVADIGIPLQAAQHIETYVLGERVARFALHWRKPDAHKGDLGHVAMVAGSVGMTGAATLAAEGALRIGTGLVTVAVPESLNDILEVKLTEAMTVPVPECPSRAFGKASLDRVLEIIEARDAAVIGPGFGRDDDTIKFTLALLKKLKKPAVVDADALYAIATDVDALKKCKAPLVITPHPGEMARLLGTTVTEVQSNRLEVARSFAQGQNVTVVLKGAGTVIASPDGRAFINTTGTPGMATGGTGDVLSGMIGGLLAMGEDPIDAANAAVYIHGLAGEKAAEKLGPSSMIASDVAANIADAIQDALHNVFEEE